MPITFSVARMHVENFLNGYTVSETALKDLLELLTRCEADQKRLDAALEACQAFIDGKDSGEVWDLAQKALGV